MNSKSVVNTYRQLIAAVFCSSVLFLLPSQTSIAGQQPPQQQATPQPPPPAAPTPAPPQGGPDESTNDLNVAVGKSVIVNSSVPIERVSVGYGDVAEAHAVSPTEVLVNGKMPGETSLIIWQEGGGKLFFDLTVQPSHFASKNRADILRNEIHRELPGQKIEVNVENDLVFLRGTANDLASAERAVAIASAVGKPVNLLYVNVPPPEKQILLKVRFASVDRTLSTQLGINIFDLGGGKTVAGATTQQFSPPTIGSAGTGGSTTTGGSLTANGYQATLTNALNLLIFRTDIDVGATIQALEQKGIIEILAEPNVLAENGKQASFLAGGQFPYPVIQGGNVGGTTAITIQFAQFGVRLNFIPTITPRGSIRLQVAPEVSALDYSNGVTIGGFTVPGIDVRNVNTEVELSEGQSFAIGGLLDNRENETFSKIPFIGDIPILGKFFQSKTKTRTNTELMVIVTPQIVQPMPAGRQIALPKYPVPFLPPNTPGVEMATPGPNVTGPAAPTPTASIPVETLIKSYNEKPLVVSTTSGTFGAAQNVQGVNPNGAANVSPPVTITTPTNPTQPPQN